ncbi:hypothetical protein FKP32DRAFT_1648708 [Trametes sanguinea]|nr:hypothetical protein FKP32DRAFT_1648708 [Trametes sanguinea]
MTGSDNMAGQVPLYLDVIAHIAEQLSPGTEPLSFTVAQDPIVMSERLKCQRALGRLAQVSREVSAVALDVLWRHVDDFRCLLRIFPSCDSDSKQQGFRDVISDADWARFQTYAVRVRSLYLGYINNIHANVWTILTRLAGHSALLPNLERLTGFVVDEYTICQTLLLSPALRELELVIGQTANAGIVRMLMDSAQDTLFALDRLTVDHVTRRYTDQPPLIEFWAFTQLQTLRVTQEVSLTDDELQALAAFPNLQSLDLKLALMTAFESRSIPPFAQLRDLTLSGELASIARFVASTSLPALDTFSLSCAIFCDDHFASGTRGKTTMITLCDSLPMSIRRLHLSVACGCDRHWQHPSSRLSDLFAHLRTLGALRSLQFMFTPRMSASNMLSDDVFYSIRDAWPELRTFQVGSLDDVQGSERLEGGRMNYGYAPGPRRRGHRYISPDSSQGLRNNNSSLAISSLAAFAYGHPHLQVLEVPSLDLKAIPDLDSVPILGHALRELRVGKLVSGARLFDCALVLDLLFPHLDLRDARSAVGAGEADRRDQLLLEGILLGLQAGRGGSHWTHAAALGGYDADVPLLSRRHQKQPVHSDQELPDQPEWATGHSSSRSRSRSDSGSERHASLRRYRPQPRRRHRSPSLESGSSPIPRFRGLSR